MNDPLALRALELLRRLEALLQEEFEALRRREPQQVERLQPQKTTLLAQINQLMEAAGVQPGRPTPPGWESAAVLALGCRDLHQRNAALIDRQLDAVRGALQALHQGGEPAGTDLYERRPRRSGLPRGGSGQVLA